MYSYSYYYVPAKKFTKQEILHLIISLLVLTTAFSLAFSDFAFNRNASRLARVFPIALISVATGFLLHEIMHKVTAQKYGCWAEYRMFPLGLMLALVVSLIGFVFAAPGAVMIAGAVDKEQNGKISLAGPLTNIIIAMFFLPLKFIFLSGYIADAVFMVYLVNVFLAVFNLLPIYPLDGSKIVRWNVPVYILVLMTAVILLLSPF